MLVAPLLSDVAPSGQTTVVAQTEQGDAGTPVAVGLEQHPEDPHLDEASEELAELLRFGLSEDWDSWSGEVLDSEDGVAARPGEVAPEVSLFA